MGIPFIPTRGMIGSDTFKYSGAKIVEDPFTKKPVCLIPAINPDVALIHVHESDVYGNGRVFGSSVSPFETAASSRKVILCAERIIQHGRRNVGVEELPSVRDVSGEQMIC
jgi:glutaconate CoA-transferase subunit A